MLSIAATAAAYITPFMELMEALKPILYHGLCLTAQLTTSVQLSTIDG